MHSVSTLEECVAITNIISKNQDQVYAFEELQYIALMDVNDAFDAIVIYGSVCVMEILVADLTVVVAANLEAIHYYCQNWGIKEGLDMYRVLGPQYVPNGILSLIQSYESTYEGTGSKTLFRGDRSSATPNIAFKEGFTPKGTGDDLLAHITSNTTPGDFVSTTVDKSIAQGFAGKNGYVYEINTSNYIAVNKTLGANSPFPEQMEFAIPGGISPSQIKGAWVIQGGQFTGEFILNPGYTGGN